MDLNQILTKFFLPDSESESARAGVEDDTEEGPAGKKRLGGGGATKRLKKERRAANYRVRNIID